MRSITLLAAGCLLACAPATYQYPTLRSVSQPEQYVLGESRLMPGETLFEALRRTRPTLMHVRGVSVTANVPSESEEIGVFINGTFAGGLEALRTINAREVATVRRLRGVDANNRFAGRFREGALDVQLIR